jgi:hypothetical protein
MPSFCFPTVNSGTPCFNTAPFATKAVNNLTMTRLHPVLL